MSRPTQWPTRRGQNAFFNEFSFFALFERRSSINTSWISWNNYTRRLFIYFFLIRYADHSACPYRVYGYSSYTGPFKIPILLVCGRDNNNSTQLLTRVKPFCQWDSIRVHCRFYNHIIIRAARAVIANKPDGHFAPPVCDCDPSVFRVTQRRAAAAAAAVVF